LINVDVDIPSNVKQIDSISYGIQSNHFKDMEGFFQECDYDGEVCLYCATTIAATSIISPITSRAKWH
jgi:hypothetical protein